MLNYQQSCQRLQELGHVDPGPLPPLPSRCPHHDDETLGIRFFRTRLTDSMESLTLTRTFIAHPEIHNTSFRNSDLTESTLCWNDFENADFSRACLSSTDMRCSIFKNCNFSSADLRKSDLRRSTFDNCDFSDADLHGAIIKRGSMFNRIPAWAKTLSAAQIASIHWTTDDGDEPEGG